MQDLKHLNRKVNLLLTYFWVGIAHLTFFLRLLHKFKLNLLKWEFNHELFLLNLEKEIMLRAIPKSWLSWNCDIIENNFPIGSLEFPSWKQNGKILIKDFEYRVRAKGLFTASFFLDNYDRRLGYAQQTNHFVRVLNLNYAESEYKLKLVAFLSQKLILQKNKQTLGIIYSKNILSRQAIIDLPTTLPLEFRLFVTWIAIWFWRQSQRNIA